MKIQAMVLAFVVTGLVSACGGDDEPSRPAEGDDFDEWRIHKVEAVE